MIAYSEYRIEYKNGQRFRLKPLFDWHLMNAHCDERSLRQYLANSDEDTYFVGGGDLIDCIVATDPRYRKSTDKTGGDSIIDEQVDAVTDTLEPYADRIIGLGEGNHEDVIVKKCGTNPIERVCKNLKLKYLGFSWLLTVRFSQDKSRTRSMVIRGHHGWGGGSRTQGADLTKYSKDVGYWDADLFLYGHVHRKQADKVPRLGLVGDKIIANPKTMVLCGTFLKTLSPTTDPTYSEIKGYPPVEIGGVDVWMEPVNHESRVKVSVEI